MDDFDVILGIDFLVEQGSIPIPSIRSLLIMGEKPSIEPEREATFRNKAIVYATI